MAQFLSQLHTDLRETLQTRRGATDRPENVPTFIHKEYARMPLLSLPEPTTPRMTLAEVLEKRHSAESGNPTIPLSMEECGTLLGFSLRKRPGSEHRNYPSAGALYPIETYVISSALEGQPLAVFHYNPTKHGLERLWDFPDNFTFKDIVSQPEPFPFSTIIIFTSVWHRSAAKYGDVSYVHALIEVGHMSENVLLVGTALGLNMRPMASFNDELVIKLLHLDKDREQPVHSITLSKGGETSRQENSS